MGNEKVFHMAFDHILHVDGGSYGILQGDDTVVFIKKGLGGGFTGLDDKYLHLSCRLHRIYGCSVIVASNPDDGREHTERDRQAIEQYVCENRISTPRLLLFGNSNGCIKGLALAQAGVLFERMVLVNMPLMINFHKTKQHLATLTQTEIVAVYGQRDPSFSYIPFLEGKAQHLRVLQIPDADHIFSGMTQVFLELGDLLMTT